jgi:small subunit ribosomal protein S20
MAHSLSAKKRIRQNAKNAARNRWRIRNLRVAVKDFLKALSHGTNPEAEASYKKLVKVIDRSAQKGVIHKNQAARRKSRLTKRLKSKLGTAKKA